MFVTLIIIWSRMEDASGDTRCDTTQSFPLGNTQGALLCALEEHMLADEAADRIPTDIA